MGKKWINYAIKAFYKNSYRFCIILEFRRVEKQQIHVKTNNSQICQTGQHMFYWVFGPSFIHFSLSSTVFAAINMWIKSGGPINV